MPRPTGKVPSYCLHRASAQAVVRLDGRDHYRGRYGSPESHAAYQRLIAEWRTRQVAAAAKPSGSNGSAAAPTINHLILQYDNFSRTYYSRNGAPTKEYVEMRCALRYVQELYGRVHPTEFGPLALKAVRQKMAENDLSRGVVNQRNNRIKRFFKWAVSEEFVPPQILEGLRAVAGLRFGRTTVRETDPVKPVPRAFVEATLPHVSDQVAALVRLQLATGMRPCEVLQIRACDIDTSGEVWIYEPRDHKNRWRGHQRLVPLGPQAQTIIGPFLSLDTTAYLFRPTDAERARNAARRASRKSRMTPLQAGRRPKVHPKRAKRDRYDTGSYRRAIKYGVAKANRPRGADVKIPDWCPLQLRHTRATEIRRQFGIEAAQVVLGHARADVTQIYAERNLAAAAVDVEHKIG